MAEQIDVKITDNSKEFKQAMENISEIALEAVGLQAVSHAKSIITANGSVDTGLLRASIAYAIGGKLPSIGSYRGTNKKAHTYHNDAKSAKGSYSGTMPKDKNGEISVYIGTNVEYGKHVELGARGRAAKPFIKPAAENYSGEYAQIIKQHMQNA